MKHKHYDVLVAIAEGRAVECKKMDFDRAYWFTPDFNSITPLMDCEYEWRVRVEPVIIVKYFRFGSNKNDVCYKLVYSTCQGIEVSEWDLKVTFIDGKAISVELPKP